MLQMVLELTIELQIKIKTFFSLFCFYRHFSSAYSGSIITFKCCFTAATRFLEYIEKGSAQDEISVA